MITSDGRFAIVFNGEVYNFEALRRQLQIPDGGWRTRTDTEVVVESYRQWGSGCVSRFQGMFALAIWDRQCKSLFVARDRLGVKPLYFAATANHFLFGSRPSALLAARILSPQVDPQALRFYLEAGYIPAPWSLYREIRKLEPGHHLLLSDERLTKSRYWALDNIEPDAAMAAESESSLIDQLAARVHAAVSARTVSDVPIGAFLSGGIDSSLVVSAMRRCISRVRTFTLGFHEEAFDETADAARIANKLDVELTVERLNAVDLLELVPRYFEAFDEPLFDSSAFAVLAVSRLARRDVTVALTGDGGDELFGGYPYYRLVDHLARAYRFGSGPRWAAAHVLRCVPGHRAALGAEALSQRDWLGAFAFMRSIGKDFERIGDASIYEGTMSFSELLRERASRFPKTLSPSECAMRLDAAYTLPDAYLQKADIAKMANSLEAREPLLDHELVEWAMRLPVKWKLRGGTLKWLARRLCERDVDKRIAWAPKRGFMVPIDVWLRNELREWAGDKFRSSLASSGLPVNVSAVLRLHSLHLSGRRNTHPILWAMLVLASAAEEGHA